MATHERMEALKQRKAQLEKQIAELETRARARERKEENRLKVLVGAAALADCKMNPRTEVFIRELLKRAIVAKRDREFLQDKGWLKPAQAEPEEPGQ